MSTPQAQTTEHPVYETAALASLAPHNVVIPRHTLALSGSEVSIAEQLAHVKGFLQPDLNPSNPEDVATHLAAMVAALFAAVFFLVKGYPGVAGAGLVIAGVCALGAKAHRTTITRLREQEEYRYHAWKNLLIVPKDTLANALRDTARTSNWLLNETCIEDFLERPSCERDRWVASFARLTIAANRSLALTPAGTHLDEQELSEFQSRRQIVDKLIQRSNTPHTPTHA